jgi:hypothetical protein
MIRFLRDLCGVGMVVCFVGCEGMGEQDASRPVAERKSLSERMTETSGYKQDADGNWVPRSDKRSEYDSQRESAYFKGKVDKKAYETGDYKKKSWWGRETYEAGNYGGDTDGSRFQTQARQDGQMWGDGNKQADQKKPYETNTVDRLMAREGSSAGIDRPGNDYTEAQRKTYKAPSVIDWKEQREMSNRSRGILGE